MPWCSSQVLQPAQRMAQRMHGAEPLLERRARPPARPSSPRVRAARSPPSANARPRLRQIRPAPSSAIASAGGLSRGDRNVSMQCDSASSPVAAVRPGGSPSVSSGSQIARFGIRCGLMHAELAAVGERQQRRAPDLRAGPRRRRNRDHRRDRGRDPPEPAVDGGILLQRPLVGRQQRHALGEVDRRAAAQRHDPVAAPSRQTRAPPPPPPRSGSAACRGSYRRAAGASRTLARAGRSPRSPRRETISGRCETELGDRRRQARDLPGPKSIVVR